MCGLDYLIAWRNITSRDNDQFGLVEFVVNLFHNLYIFSDSRRIRTPYYPF